MFLTQKWKLLNFSSQIFITSCQYGIKINEWAELREAYLENDDREDYLTLKEWVFFYMKS